MMPTIHEIKEQIQEQRNPKYLMGGVLELLPVILSEDEVFLTAETVRVEGNLSSLIATNEGFVSVTCFSPGNSVTEYFPYSQILSISIEESAYMSERFLEMTIEDEEKKVTFSQIEKSGLEELLSVSRLSLYMKKENVNGMLRFVKFVHDENELPIEAE